MLTEEQKGYSGIANYYRERLIGENILKVKENGGDIPFYYDVIGGVKQTANILGAQYLRVYAMTTFDEAAEMSNNLAKKGISNQVMNFQGWFNGGYYHDVANKIKVIGKLGGKSDLENLNTVVAENGGRFYGDVIFQNVSFISKRFPYTHETSRYYGSGYIASFGQVNPANLRRTSSLGYTETMYDILSPKYLPRYVGKFTKKIDKYDIDGISLRDLGDALYADKKRTNVISREQSLDVVKAQFDLLQDTNKNLMVSGGNDYTFPYVTDIINAPITANDYFIIDEAIPLYQMIIHGSIDYSGKQLNISNTNRAEMDILELIEYGASCHYVFTWENSTEMKYTGLNKYYSTTFSEWQDKAVNMYLKINEALKHVSNAYMIEHDRVQENVVKVTYSNGVIIYINYANTDEVIDGITIPAKNYVLGGI